MIINKGKIVADGTAADLRKKAQGKEILKVTVEDGDINEIFNAMQNLETTETVDIIDKSGNVFEVQSKNDVSSRRAIFNMCKENNWVLTQMAFVETKLEDVFRELTMN